MYRLIYGLGIRYVGEATAKTLAQAINHLLELKNFSLEDLQKLEDIGPKVASAIYQFFSNKENVSLLKELEKQGLQLKNEKKSWLREVIFQILRFYLPVLFPL